jgi:hypothetical protein
MDFFIFALFVAVGAVFVYLGTRVKCVESGLCDGEGPRHAYPDPIETKGNRTLRVKKSSWLFALAGIFMFCAAAVLFGAVLMGLTVAAVTLAVTAVLSANGHRYG